MGRGRVEKCMHEIISPNDAMDFKLDFFVDSGSVVNKHYHDWLEIVYLLKGTLEVEENNERRLLKENDFVVLDPMCIHSTRCREGNTAILLQIPMAWLEKFMPDIHCLMFRVEEEKVYETGDPQIYEVYGGLRDRIKELGVVYLQAEEGYIFQCYSLIFSIMHLLVRYFSRKISRQDRMKSEKNLERIRRIMEYIRNHYREELPLSRIAGEIGLNPAYFSRFFREQMGIPYLEYVNRIRLEHIYTDLLYTDLPVGELQERHGFYNYKLFMRMFRQVYGCTPGKVRGGKKS